MEANKSGFRGWYNNDTDEWVMPDRHYHADIDARLKGHFFVHKMHSWSSRWAVTAKNSGRILSDGRTRREAVERGKELFLSSLSKLGEARVIGVVTAFRDQ